jgi:hypothetical protein
MKRAFLFQAILFLFLTFNTLAQEYRIENKYSRINIGANKITSLFDKTRNIDHSTGINTLKSLLKIQLVDGVQPLEEIDINQMKVTVLQDKKSISIDFKHELVEGKAIISLSDSQGDLIFAVTAKPKNSKHAISRIDFPRFETPSYADGKEKFCLTPYREGRITPISVVLSGGNEFNNFFTYPKYLFSQFIACLGDKGGFLLWTDDKDGYTKEFGREYSKENSMFAVKHFMQYEAGKEQNLSYVSRIRFSGPEWQDAADIYKTWSDKQAWATTRLKYRKDTPEILRGPILSLTCDIDLGEDLTKLPDVLNAWKKKYNVPIVYRPTGWEKNGVWMGIDYFPASVGNDAFRNLANEIHQDGNLVGTFISGFSWKNVLNAKEGKEYEKGINRGTVKERNDLLMKSYISNHGDDLCETDKNGKVKKPVRVCRGSDFGRTFLQKTAYQMFDLGADLVHDDVDFGTFQFATEGCFNPSHGHPIPCGLWEVDITRKAFQEIRQEANNRGIRDFILSKEYCTELFIQDLNIYQTRFFRQMTDPFHLPLSQYLFHEYVFTSFGWPAANAADISIPAMMITSGTLPCFRSKKEQLEMPAADNHPQVILFKDYFAAMKNHGMEFLSYGTMKRDLIADAPYSERKITEATVVKVEGGTETIKFDQPVVEKVPQVVQSTWEDDKGNTGVFTINTLKTNQLVHVTCPKGGKYEAVFYQGSDQLKTETVTEGDNIKWDIPTGRLCSVVFSPKK